MPDSIHPRSWTARLNASVAGARFFTFSLFIHVIILIVGSSVVIFKAYVEAPDFVAGGDFVGSDDAAAPPPETPPALQQEEVKPDVQVATSSPMDIISSSTASTDFRVVNATVARPGASIDGMSEKVASLGKGMGTGGGGVTGGTMLRFMGTQARASSAIFVVDVSGSMISGEKTVKTYEVLEREIAKVVKGLTETMRFGLVVFSRDAKSYHPTLVKAVGPEKEKALNWLRKLGPEQGRDPKADEDEREFHHGTRADRGLQEAFTMQPDVIFFVSDGEPTGSTPAQILAQVQAAQKNSAKNVIVNVVAYCADGGQQFMKDLAQQNQGTFREVNPKDVN